jgi:hypothetical protein
VRDYYLSLAKARESLTGYLDASQKHHFFVGVETMDDEDVTVDAPSVPGEPTDESVEI